MQKTNISYLDFTWNPGCGCPLPVPSAGCTHCWARGLHDKRHGAYVAGKKLPSQYAKPFHEVQMFPDRLVEPFRRKKPAKIGVQFMGDLFAFPFEWLNSIFTVMESVPRHRFVLLTKRPKQMMEYVSWRWVQNHYNSPPEHIHVGVTVENQDNVWRIADLIKTPAAKRFISFEPLLEETVSAIDSWDRYSLAGIDYAFIGCESGPGARLCSQESILNLAGRCQRAGVKVHIKQIPLNGKCNKNIEEWPKEFQIREE